MADIHRDVGRGRGEKIGRVNGRNGRVYETQWGPDQYIGRVDYERGKVWAHRRLWRDRYLGRVTEDGKIYRHLRFRPDRYEGRVEQNGTVFEHARLRRDDYQGRVTGMRHPVEGAAALLLFFLPAGA